MPYKKKAPAKRTRKAVGGNLSASHLSAAQKRLLGTTQSGAVKKGSGAITKQIVGMTRKFGDQRKAAAKGRGLAVPPSRQTGLAVPPSRKAPSKSSKDQMARAAIARGVPKATGKKIVAIPKKGPKRGGIAMSKAARANLIRMQKEAFRTGKSNPKLAALTKKHGMLVKRGDAQKQMQGQTTKRVGKLANGNRSRVARAAQGSAARKLVLARRRAAIRKQQAAANAARKRRGSSTTRPATGSLKQRITSRSGTVAQRRARALAARRRAAAAARRGRPAKRGPISRIPRQPTRGRMTPAQLAAARKRAAAAGRRRALARQKSKSATGNRSRAARMAQGRAAMAARKRRAPISSRDPVMMARRRAAVARRRAAAIAARKRKAPTRRAPTRRAPVRRAPTRRPVRRMRRR